MSGRFTWSRGGGGAGATSGARAAPVHSTPILFAPRITLAAWQADDVADGEGLAADALAVLEHLRAHGAGFFGDIVAGTGLLRTQVENALSALTAAGLCTNDSFAGLRALIAPRSRKQLRGRARYVRAAAPAGIENAGRWSLHPSQSRDPESAAEHVARVLLRRYGVVFRALWARERCTVPWRDLLRVYRRMEARGELRGGRFVAGPSGEHYATPEAVSRMRAVRRRGANGTIVTLSAVDPASLIGTLGDERRPKQIAANRVTYRDGVPIAVRESGEHRFLVELDDQERWETQLALTRDRTGRRPSQLH